MTQPSRWSLWFRRIALYVSPLCLFFHVLAYVLTDERYRNAIWFILAAGLLPSLLFTLSLLSASAPGRPRLFGKLMLVLSLLVWLLGTALGLFSVLVSGDPNWFH